VAYKEALGTIRYRLNGQNSHKLKDSEIGMIVAK
jgi:hypothetical protein